MSLENAFDAVSQWQDAASLAARLHAGQLRKDGKTPYVAHPFRVALTVSLVFECHDRVAITVALLHDLIEDTTADYDEIRAAFGAEVAEGVACLSKDKRLPEEVREPRFYRQIAAGSWQARLVKLADAYDNVSDAPDQVAREKAVGKAKLAIEATGEEERLQPAVQKLIALMGG